MDAEEKSREEGLPTESAARDAVLVVVHVRLEVDFVATDRATSVQRAKL